MKSFIVLIGLFILPVISGNAQNLIQNPGFDHYFTYVDSNKNLVYHPKYWYYKTNSPNHPIYYCTDRFLNKALTWNPHPDSLLIKQGQNINFISVLVLPNTQKVYTEFKEPLIKGTKYHLCFDVKAFDQSDCLTDLFIGLKDCLTCNIDSFLYQVKLIIPDSVANESLFQKWKTLETDFVAKGNERVLVMFAGTSEDYFRMVHSNPDKFMIKYFSGRPGLKYFIDNVSLTAIGNENKNSFLEHLDTLKVGESVVLQNIYFDFDKYVLLKESFPVLDKIIKYLNKNMNVRLLISGHTDNIGTEEYNEELSNKRAISVVDYLVTKGIGKGRLQSVGFGSRFPVDKNESEEGRQKNRRIEMKIISK